MVLYIFHVNTGGMLTFDMEMALQTVQSLKETIERLHGIPSANQVLLISGGEVLQPSSRVCSYSSGTDENPIYMFSTLFDSSKHLSPWPSIESHTHYEEEVGRCQQMPADYNTVVVCAKLAQKMYESATKEIKVCEKLVFEQHLQQQGWAAVMANLEDLINEFKQRRTDFLVTIDDYTEQRPNYLSYLESFQDDLTKLSTVPILNEILPSASNDFHGFDEYFQDNVSLAGSAGAGSAGSNRGASSSSSAPTTQSDESSHSETVAAAHNTQNDVAQPTADADAQPELESSDQKQQQRSLTLLQWISTKENHQTLKEMAEHCSQVLRHFDDTAIKNIKTTIEHVLKKAEKDDVREVRGLTERLEQLDELMCSAKKIVQEQKELSMAMTQHQARANNLGDASVLPVLCQSHSKHLDVMLTNHNKLLDIEKRFMKAKQELASNLSHRLEMVVHIQSWISDLDSKLLFHHRCFRRLKHHFVIVEQIHHAPTVYVTAVTEVVRRRLFSNGFTKWATELANHMLAIHEEEVLRRQDFGLLFENHFLNALFTGLDDMPPAFATATPPAFDQNLPNLTKSELDALKASIPEIASSIELPDLKDVLKFFARGFSSQSSMDETRVAEIMKLAMLKPSLHAHLRDGFESETDTEEFEKLGQSPIDRQSSSDSKIITGSKIEMMTTGTSTDPIEVANSETLTEENENSAQIEIDRLRALLKSMSALSLHSIGLLRDQLRSIGDDVNCNRTSLSTEFEKIEKSWSSLKQQQESTERELVSRLTVDHELELDDIRKSLTSKDDEIAALKCDNSKLLGKLANTKLESERVAKQTTDETDSLRARLEELQLRVANFECEKEKAVNEIKDKLNREHKTEIESLRCRYKLMKNMDRSPSDTSLEKIDRPELIEYERSGGRSTLQASSPKSPTTGQSLYRRILDEKERQIDDLNNQLQMMVKENAQLKESVQSLADYDQPSAMNVEKLQKRIDALEKDKARLKQKLKSTTENSSGDVVSSSKTSSTTRPRFCSKKCIRVESCENGDTVLVIWNEQLCRYTIIQDSQHIHFLAEDSYPSFNLPVPSTKDILFENIEKPSHFFGTVTEKQYCMVKKDGTRYRVPIGTKFCRIKVKPLPPASRHSSSSEYDKPTSKRSGGSEKPAPVSRSLSIQMMDSFAQTEVVNNNETKMTGSLVDRDMVDSGVVAQVRQSDRISINEDDEGAVTVSYDDRYRGVSVSEEDEAVVVDNRSSQEEANVFELMADNLLSSERDQDDSDEYRSLETKDDE